MLKIGNMEIYGWDAAIRGMRNPLNSWHMSDSKYCHEMDSCGQCPNVNNCHYEIGNEYNISIGSNDMNLMKKLAKGGPVHAKYRRMITVYVDILAPLYWWKEFDTYKIGTVANSCSTMHKLTHKEFELEDFSTEHMDKWSLQILKDTIRHMNYNRNLYLDSINPDDKKQYWWQIIQLLPTSYNQKRTVMLNYEVLANIYETRKGHKLDEWQTVIEWIEGLPYSELITGGE